MPSLVLPSPKPPTIECILEIDELPNPIDVNVDPFEEMLDKMRMTYHGRIRQLSLEVESLRNQLTECRREDRVDFLGSSSKHDGLCEPLESAVSAPSTPKSIESQGMGKQALTSNVPLTSLVGPATQRKAPDQLAGSGTHSRTSFLTGEASRGLSTARKQRSIDEMIRKKDPLYRMVHSPSFEVCFAVLIALFGVCMAFEAQYIGFDLAAATGHASASEPSKLVWPGGQKFLTMAHWVFGGMFLIEMALKIVGMRLAFAYDPWNWMDLIVNCLWVYSLLEITAVPVNPQIVRIARLARLLRLIRLVRFMNGLNTDSLYLMATAVRSSVSALAWAIALLLLVHFALSIFLNQILRETYFNFDDPEIAVGQSKVFEYFGTFSRSLLTMFEITLANWPPACRVLIENVSEWFILYALLHKMVLGFAVIGVVNGVFIQETFKVATSDDAVMVKQTMRKQAAHQKKMMCLFEEADGDGNGYVDIEEWKKVCEDDWVKMWLTSQDLNAEDAQSLFRLIDDGDGRIGAKELVTGASRLKGSAATLDMLKLVTKIDGLVTKIDGIFPERSASSLK